MMKPFKYGVVVATSSILLAFQLATDLRLKGFFASGRQGALANAAYRVNPRQIRKALFHRLTTFPSIEGYRVPRNASKRERGGTMSKDDRIHDLSEVQKPHAMGQARQVGLLESRWVGALETLY